MHDAALTPHVLGQHDCVVGNVGPAIQAVTGEDFYTQHIGKYDSRETALAHMNAQGFASLSDWLASFLPEIHPSRVQIGDVGVIEEGDHPIDHAIGVVIGDRVMVLAPQGRATVNLRRLTRAFRVG